MARAPFDESKHPRGNTKNPGQFGHGGGGARATPIPVAGVGTTITDYAGRTINPAGSYVTGVPHQIPTAQVAAPTAKRIDDPNSAYGDTHSVTLSAQHAAALDKWQQDNAGNKQKAVFVAGDKLLLASVKDGHLGVDAEVPFHDGQGHGVPITLSGKSRNPQYGNAYATAKVAASPAASGGKGNSPPAAPPSGPAAAPQNSPPPKGESSSPVHHTPLADYVAKGGDPAHHKYLVDQALKAGESVPAHVFKDHPDLWTKHVGPDLPDPRVLHEMALHGLHIKATSSSAGPASPVPTASALTPGLAPRGKPVRRQRTGRLSPRKFSRDADFSWDESQHPRDRGKWTRKPEVHAADDPAHYGSRYHNVYDANGTPVRGEPISPDDPRVPNHLYHMTTNMSAVLESGYLRASGVGGLGGDRRDRIVSLTADPEIARQLAQDLRWAATLARRAGTPPPLSWDGEKWVGDRTEWSAPVYRAMQERARSEGWEFSQIPLQLQQYSLGDLLGQYFTARESKVKIRNPLLYDAENLAKIDPSEIGVVRVPKHALKTGALVTDFDLDNPYGLKEIRVYGDVPVVEKHLGTADFSTFDESQHPRSRGKFAAKFTSSPPFQRLATIGKNAYHTLHTLESGAKARFDRLPAPVRYTAAGAFKVFFAPYTAGQLVARQVALEKGGEEHAARVGRVLLAIDLAGAKFGPVIAGTLFGPAGAAAGYWLPLGSLSYIAYSTARDPLILIKAARSAVRRFADKATSAMAGSSAQFSSSDAGPAYELSAERAEHLLHLFSGQKDRDWLEACLCAAADKLHGNFADTVETGLLAYKSGPPRTDFPPPTGEPLSRPSVGQAYEDVDFAFEESKHPRKRGRFTNKPKPDANKPKPEQTIPEQSGGYPEHVVRAARALTSMTDAQPVDFFMLADMAEEAGVPEAVCRHLRDPDVNHSPHGCSAVIELTQPGTIPPFTPPKRNDPWGRVLGVSSQNTHYTPLDFGVRVAEAAEPLSNLSTVIFAGPPLNEGARERVTARLSHAITQTVHELFERGQGVYYQAVSHEPVGHWELSFEAQQAVLNALHLIPVGGGRPFTADADETIRGYLTPEAMRYWNLVSSRGYRQQYEDNFGPTADFSFDPEKHPRGHPTNKGRFRRKDLNAEGEPLPPMPSVEEMRDTRANYDTDEEYRYDNEYLRPDFRDFYVAKFFRPSGAIPPSGEESVLWDEVENLAGKLEPGDEGYELFKRLVDAKTAKEEKFSELAQATSRLNYQFRHASVPNYRNQPEEYDELRNEFGNALATAVRAFQDTGHTVVGEDGTEQLRPQATLALSVAAGIDTPDVLEMTPGELEDLAARADKSLLNGDARFYWNLAFPMARIPLESEAGLPTDPGEWEFHQRFEADFSWDESKHPRGQPENKGRFAARVGGLAAHEFTPSGQFPPGASESTDRELGALSAHVINSLTDEEKQAVNFYTAKLAGGINRGLRENDVSGHFKPYISALDSVFAKTPPLPEPVVAHRGVDLYGPPLQKLLAMFHHAIESGDLVECPAFTSTSMGTAILENMDAALEIRVGHALYIASLSEHPHERELLIPRGAKFRVVGFIDHPAEGVRRPQRTYQLEQVL